MNGIGQCEMQHCLQAHNECGELGSESGEKAAPLDLAALEVDYLYARRAQPNIQHKKIYDAYQKSG
jgi:hypothetical protein